MTIKGIITGIVIGLFVAILVMGGLSFWYIIEEGNYCRKHEEANPNIIFEWEFKTGCVFQLPDGTWINLREYERRNEYRLEIDE